MPTTSNFGWTTPADTDLVKDGAAAIRTLGNGIDTSFLDLKGGTTDQVLAKNSNTDLDFKWVAQDDSNAIQNAIVDAKGDLISATAADTPARLAVGTNGQVLQADSTTATGLKWATPAAGGKVLQVVNATHSTQVTTSTGNFDATGLTVTITPTLATSKVLVLVSQNGLGKDTNNTYIILGLFRGATQLALFETNGADNNGAGENFIAGSSICYLDAPATTSATTYSTKIESGGHLANAYAQYGSAVSTITVMEIGA